MRAQRAVLSDEGLANGLPSTVVAVEIQYQNRRHLIRIPQLELHRVRKILVKGEYALPTRNFLRSAPVVIDVGANVGLFTMYMKLLYPDCVVHCYEPVPATLSLLQRNLEALVDVHVHPYALGERDGEQQIYLHRRNTGQNSFKRIEGDKHYDRWLNIPIRDSARELDALGQDHIDVLKIDTEGYELEILERLGDRLNMVSYVLIEYHSEEDRRKIDRCLSQFALCGTSGIHVDRGTLKYQNRSLAKTSGG